MPHFILYIISTVYNYILLEGGHEKYSGIASTRLFQFTKPPAEAELGFKSHWIWNLKPAILWYKINRCCLEFYSSANTFGCF